MIRVENVNKTFGKKHVLKDISTVFETGKTNLIIGRSGSGKTVLLKSIVALYGVDSGSILYADTDITKLNFKDLKSLRQEVGMLFQGGALFDSQTVLENVMFPLNMFSDMTHKEKLKRVAFCLDRVDLHGVGKLYPAEISGGMAKRVAIARAIALNPKYLFCDEPNSGLDPLTSIRIDKLISELTKEYNITTIINTHDMNSVMEIGEKITFISEGVKCWEGSKDNIFHTDNEELNNFVFASDLCKRIRDVKKL
jgi:phospholipid/cholesterol/gamma-HCH transport system ATP-binding protein